MEKLYRDCGEIKITNADNANIPVDIWISPRDEGDSAPEAWKLYANNYMPRRGYLSGNSSYKAYSDSREVLVELVKKHWLPLYQVAVDILSTMEPNENGNARLYYWSK